MRSTNLLAGAALALALSSAAYAQVPASLMACPAGTHYASTEGAGAANPKLATEGAGAANPKLATEGAGAANPKLATEGAGAANPKLATEGAGAANPKLASAQASSAGMAVKLSNGVARMPDGTYCSPVQ